MYSSKKIATRFAPSPSGKLHLGNIRAALINFLFAKKNSGSFLLRIEDTDKQRSSQDHTNKILKDLEWLNLEFEKPIIYQSKRTEIYKSYLEKMVNLNVAYRCFCTKERLANLKNKQIEEKKPPRYDRTCAALSSEKIKKKIDFGLEHCYRFKLEREQIVLVNDLSKGKIQFKLSNFSDPVIARSDETFTFIFTNMIDDMETNITHVIRGEDHLSNSALQVAMNYSLQRPAPNFIHLPMICDQSGKKMSKRVENFNLDFLKENGILPEAINSYLANLGLSGEEEKICSLEEMAKDYKFEKLSSQSSCKYDFEKLEWTNSKWLEKLSAKNIFLRIKKLNSNIKITNENLILKAIELVKDQAKNLVELWNLIKFTQEKKSYPEKELLKIMSTEEIELSKKIFNSWKSCEHKNFDSLKKIIKDENANTKNVFTFIRYTVTGQTKGLSVGIIIELIN